MPLEPVHETLRTLAGTLTGLTLLVLAIALRGVQCVGVRSCQLCMADAARSMGATDMTDRLPTPASADELTDLGVAFNGLLDRLGEAFERGALRREASHQLRTPLAAVIGQVEVALRATVPRTNIGACSTPCCRRRNGCGESWKHCSSSRSESDAGLPGFERIDLAAWIPERMCTWKDHPRR